MNLYRIRNMHHIGSILKVILMTIGVERASKITMRMIIYGSLEVVRLALLGMNRTVLLRTLFEQQ